MTAQEMIADIRARFPNTYPDAQLINWINQAIEETWEDLAFEEVAGIDLAGGKGTYPLPDDCEFRGILSVVAGVRVYTASTRPDCLRPNVYYKLVENTITINPNPEDGTLFITYLKKPAKASIITDSLNIRSECTEVVINAVLAIIAKAYGEVGLANNYIADYNAALQSAREKQPLNTGAFPKIKEVKT